MKFINLLVLALVSEASASKVKDVDALTSKWQNRIDNYDPHIDAEMAANIVDNSRRKGALIRLKEKLSKLNSLKDMEEYDSTRQMIKTLEAGVASDNEKNEALGPNEFDGTA